MIERPEGFPDSEEELLRLFMFGSSIIPTYTRTIKNLKWFTCKSCQRELLEAALVPPILCEDCAGVLMATALNDPDYLEGLM